MGRERDKTGEGRYEATVTRLDARGCLVLLDEVQADLGGDGRTLWCAVRGKIHLRDRTGQKSPVVVGDRVAVSRTTEGRGAVLEVIPRRSLLSRPDVTRDHVEHVMAANADRLVIVSSAYEPPFNSGLVDRMIAVAEWNRLEVLLAVNKIDLGPAAPPQVEVYRAMGYRVLLTSAVRGDGIGELRTLLTGSVSVVAGHSGVGKTSLLNAVQPGLGLAVGQVNVVSGRGKHTTTAATYVPLAGGGAVIDTAGIREFGLFGIPRRDVPWLFRDIAAVAPGCRYPDCSHVHEPGCAVEVAVEEGRVAAFRYDAYLRILEGMEA